MMNATLDFDFFVIGYFYAAIAYVVLVFAVGLYDSLSCFSLSPKVDGSFYSQVKDLMNPANDYNIDVSECLEDITANYIADSTEHYQLPSDLFENVLFEALNDLIDEFAQAPDRFLKTHHTQQIDRIAQTYLNS